MNYNNNSILEWKLLYSCDVSSRCFIEGRAPASYSLVAHDVGVSFPPKVLHVLAYRICRIRRITSADFLCTIQYEFIDYWR
jgi:hypothetical protein